MRTGLDSAARVLVATAAIALTLCGPAYAQTPAPQKPPKQPPAPLFPRHRRGIYTNGLGFNVVDATPQSPPLQTDDPGVPDKGEWEINLSSASDGTVEAHRFDVLRADVNYGMLPTIAGHELPTQLKVEFPLAAVKSQGVPYALGPGAIETGLKFNFYSNEHAGFAIALYPQVEFAPPGDSVDKGLADPGQEIILPVLVEKEFHALIVVANAGLEKPMHVSSGEKGGEATRTYSLAVGRAITRRLAAMVEWRGESSFAEGGEHLSAVNVGVIRGVRNIILYGNVGRSLSSDDALSHLYLGVGIKLLVESKSHQRAQR